MQSILININFFRRDLNIHDELKHSIFISNCPKCYMEVRTKQDLHNHLKEPHPYSCYYCDMFFVNKVSFKIHTDEHHKGKEKKIKRCRPYCVLNRKQLEDPVLNATSNPNTTYDGQIIWRPQRGYIVQKLSALSLSVILKFHKEPINITKLLKISYISIALNSENNQSIVDLSDYTNENIDVTEVSSDDEISVSTVDENYSNSGLIFKTSEVVPNIAKGVNIFSSKEVKLKLHEIIIPNEVLESGDSLALETNDDNKEFKSNVETDIYLVN